MAWPGMAVLLVLFAVPLLAADRRGCRPVPRLVAGAPFPVALYWCFRSHRPRRLARRGPLRAARRWFW